MANWKKHLEKTNKELEPFGFILDVEYSASDRCYKIWHTERGIEFIQGNLSKDELCEEISIAAIDLIEETIKKPEDVSRFFKWLVEVQDINFHPDDDFRDCITYKTGERVFTDREADALNDVMDRCFDVCDTAGVDIYELGLKELIY